MSIMSARGAREARLFRLDLQRRRCLRGARPGLAGKARPFRRWLHPGRPERHPRARARSEARRFLGPAGRDREPAGRGRQYRRGARGAQNYGCSGSGAAAHLAGELFKAMTGVQMVHIPYKGAQPALTDVIAGQAQLMFATSASAIPYIKAGRLRALAVTTAKRSASVPELPTISEAGVPGFEAITWHGVVVPAATPAATIERLNADIVRVLHMPDLRERLESLGA